MYDLLTPCVDRRNGSRGERVLKVRPIWECIAKEVRDDPGILDRVKPEEMPPCYREHPAVRRIIDSGKPPPIPLGVYFDGVRYTSASAGRQDSIVSIRVINLITHKRHMIANQRHADMCRCGCRGWCTMYVVWLFVQWCLMALVRGLRHVTSMDSRPWAERHAMHDWLHRFGQELGFTAVVVVDAM